MTNYEIYSTGFGEICIAADDQGLVALEFCGDGRELRVGPDWQRRRTELTDCAARQLEEYFAGERREFELPLNPRGTEFQRRVWDALAGIPYGETRSYREQAEALGNLKAIRAVARANGANPIAIVIPCHRVIGADGTLTGYAGGLEMKARLLTLEGARFVQQSALL
ncbi:methylated-DNA-[protein]-cysteine S-methyltransferase [Microbulbifer donghaiensis]|uniref:Methylated-DNA--protein-cysteine methyltransferase n=1 Tax=Microbulbifer donghaiensis TaxID=494016 RepID=A0A1M5G5E8_9GAMM|nr:methylated-DNA--[protein]-cysteine S-methyltransferase [Microbulbifer donghaiensis]SHF98953.1 methylated-DNA-[protein]-cysteine S-methyltransferase [Microbulbifer donghaiensis]